MLKKTNRAAINRDKKPVVRIKNPWLNPRKIKLTEIVRSEIFEITAKCITLKNLKQKLKEYETIWITVASMKASTDNLISTSTEVK